MLLDVITPHIEVTPSVCGGKPRIVGHRITVHDIAVWHERLGESIESIAASYSLKPSDVHAALAYYFDHRDEIDEQLRTETEYIEQMKLKYPSRVSAKLADGNGNVQ
mgnify:CR=1 FL=1